MVLPKATVAKIVKTNGVKRIGNDGVEEIVKAAEEYIIKLGQEANKLAEHAGRQTVKAEDVKMVK